MNRSKTLALSALTFLMLSHWASSQAKPASQSAASSSLQAKTKLVAARPKQYTIEQFLDTTRITGASFSPDDRDILYSSNKSGIFNAYTVPLAGGDPKPVTNSKTDSTYAVSYFPHDSRVLFTQDQGGNELNHLYVMNPDGSSRDLTPGTKLKAQFMNWSHDGKAFYFQTNQRDAHYFDVYKMDAASYAGTLLFENKEGYAEAIVSNDEKFIALQKTNTTIDSDIYLYDVALKQTKHITEHQGDVQNNPQSFDPESKNLHYLSDAGSEFQYVTKYSLESGKSEPVEKENWDYQYTDFSHNGKYRVTALNEDARTKIKVYERATGKLVALPQLPQGDITGVRISASEKFMAFYLNGDRSPGNLFVYDFASGNARKLTSSLNPQIDSSDLVEASVIRYKSFDGMEIPSILFKPHQASATNQVPALIWVHGGPGGQTRKGYSAVIQFLVNHGYAVLGVNNRGSSGYGKTFYTADDRKHGREPLWDCVEAKKYLASLGYVDTSKIGIIGGSYGGYMVLAALAFKPDEFTVGVDLFGVSNWLRTLQSIPPYWESIRKGLYKEIGDPNTDAQMLKDISPLFHAEQIKKPLIVLQGENDPRVIKPESDEIVAAIKKKNGVVEYVVLPGEGHGFTKKANEIKAYQAILVFLDKYLKGASGAAKASGMK